MGYYQRYKDRQQTERHQRLRTALRIIGGTLLFVGAILIISCIVMMNRRSPFPVTNTIPWQLFTGVPMVVVGFACLRAGFLNVITDYVAREVTPPVADSVKQVAEALQPTVRAVIHPPKAEAQDALTQRLKRLETLREKGLISEEEYAQKRAEILDEL